MENNELIHHGVKGMKWGVRRYQNDDGTLTDAGKKRYRTAEIFEADRAYRKKADKRRLAVSAATGAATGIASAFAGLPAFSLGAIGGAVYGGVTSIIDEHKLKKITQIYDESIATGKDITDDIIRIYGKQKIKS